MKRIRHKTIFTKTSTTDTRTREIAEEFANKVRVSDKENRVMNITEYHTPWGEEITVWYEADERVD